MTINDNFRCGNYIHFGKCERIKSLEAGLDEAKKCLDEHYPWDIKCKDYEKDEIAYQESIL